MSNLGGHSNTTWIDDGCLTYLIQRLQPQTFLDIGCGPGGMVKLALNKQLVAYGIDGDETLQWNDLRNNIYLHDFYSGPLKLNNNFDLAWSVEFLEHIEEKYLNNVFEVFKQCKYLLCTASTLKNKFHKNVQSHEYWREVFFRNGFNFSEEITNQCRLHSSMLPNKKIAPLNFIQATGMFYVNTKFN